MSDNNKTCAVGGYDIMWPIGMWNETGMPNGTNTHVIIAGDDLEFPAFKDCCAPYPVHFVKPCLMWCETNGWVAEYTQCWHDHGFYPNASSGLARIPHEDDQVKYEYIAAIIIIVAPASIFAIYMLMKYLKARRAAKSQYQELPQSETPEVEHYHDYNYGTLDRDNRVDNGQQT